MRKTSKFAALVFRCIRWLVRLFYGKAEVVGLENLPERNAIVVSNHTQMNGPIVGELFLPDSCYTWCAGQMMDPKEVPAYAFADFWSGKPKWTHPFYKLLSHIIAPITYCVFNNARTIAVYRDARTLSTFRETLRMLQEGRNILIFPENDRPCNNIVNQFETHFVDVAKLYYKKTGIRLTFVPMYIAPTLRTLYIGEGTTFDGETPIAEERERIAAYLSGAITDTARALPPHTVVPYSNIPKKQYLTNRDVSKTPRGKEVKKEGENHA